jgi:hypothetical protein
MRVDQNRDNRQNRNRLPDENLSLSIHMLHYHPFDTNPASDQFTRKNNYAVLWKQDIYKSNFLKSI